MPVYDIAFTPDFAGLQAVVRNVTTDAEVAGSPVTLDAVGAAQITLDAGIYKATASNTALAKLNVTTEVKRNDGASFDAPGAAETATRGTLYLKASAVDVDASTETWADGTGAPFALVLDTEAQGDTPIPDWADETAGVYSIIEPGAYVACLAGVGSITYDNAPASVYVDMYHMDMTGVNFGWSSDGTDDSPAFSVAATTALAFGCKDSPTNILDSATFPVSLAGLVADNYGPTTDNPVASLEAKMSITKIASGSRYTAADFA